MLATPPSSRVVALGAAAAAASGLGYAATTVIARSLAREGLGGPTALSIRFGIGGLVLAAVVVASRKSLWPAPGERLFAFLLGAVGYAFEASLFFAGLQRGSAAAVTVLFYAYPIGVALIEIALRIANPTVRLASALIVGAVGTIFVVAAGADVSVSTVGVLFALGAAASFSVYLVASDRLMVRTDTMVRAAWVSGGACIGMVARALASGGFESTSGFGPRLVALGVANAVAFGFLFAALSRIGATRTAVVLNVEPVGAVVLGALFLGESLGPWQLGGTGLVVLAAVAVALPQRTGRTPEPEVILPVHPPP